MPVSTTSTFPSTFTIRELSRRLADRETYDYTVYETARRIYDNSTYGNGNGNGNGSDQTENAMSDTNVIWSNQIGTVLEVTCNYSRAFTPFADPDEYRIVKAVLNRIDNSDSKLVYLRVRQSDYEFFVRERNDGGAITIKYGTDDKGHKGWIYVPSSNIYKVVDCSIDGLTDEKDLIFDAVLSKLDDGEEIQAKLLTRHKDKLYFKIGDELKIQKLESETYKVLGIHT